MLRHIAWFSGAPIAPDALGKLTSPDKKVEERMLAPAEDVEAMGITGSVFGNLEDADALEVTNHLQKLGVDIVVLGNMSPACLLRLARASKHLGCYVIVDFGDDIASLPELEGLASLVDLAIAADPDLAESIIKQTGITSAVIDLIDPDDDVKDARKTNAKLWMECFKYLKQKPPACANMNSPQH